ncbi:MAG: oligosaccharide flippase family protein [Lachnospiraceae bacterium]|nr:oligosaccharide flippase family protein [Lachnospiraceae bacterium]
MNLSDYREQVKRIYRTGFFHIFGTNILNKAISFVSTAVLVRILTKTEYGIFTYSWNIYSLVLMFNGLGIPSAILQMCSEHGGKQAYTERICSYGAFVGVRFDLLLTGILVGIALFAPLSIPGSKQMLLFLCLLPMVSFFYELVQMVLRAKKRNQEFARLSLLCTTLIFGVSVGGAVIFREKGMVLGYYVAYGTCMVYARQKLGIRLVGKKALVRPEEKKSLFPIAVVSMVNGAISQLLYLLDVFVLGIIVAEEITLAGYKTATLIPSALVFIPMSLVTYLYPYFAEHRNDRNWCLRRYSQVLLGIGLLNACISTGLFFLAKPIIFICYGAKYLDIIPIFRILAINYFFSGTFRILAGNLLVTQRKLKFNLFVAILCGVVNVLADYFFIPWWGAMGAAYATVMVVICSSILNVSYLVYTFWHIDRKKEQGDS